MEEDVSHDEMDASCKRLLHLRYPVLPRRARPANLSPRYAGLEEVVGWT